jgi:predicted transcriptional regulator
MSYHYDVWHDESTKKPISERNLSFLLTTVMTYVGSVHDMKTSDYPVQIQEAQEKTSLADSVKEWEETCKNCNPLTPVTCMSGCKIWKQKSEFRKLYTKMKNPRFMMTLLNTLKNDRRLQILKMISEGHHSIPRLQQELKKRGYHHSQQTIAEEYLTPLIEAGLAEENQNRYYTTAFECQLDEMIKAFSDVENVLPPHSECYEETALGMLLEKPKTYEDFEGVIPTKSVARVLSRLQKVKLVETTKENDYIIYFQTKRDSSNSKFSPTEKRVYENIPIDGISARKLAEKTNISLRRTYKYLRRLKGKKLVFTRKRPKSYALTAKGLEIAKMLKEIRNLTLETSITASHIANNNEPHEILMVATSQTKLKSNKT